MSKNALITSIQTGTAIGDKRRAILRVDDAQAKPGMLGDLTRFMRDKGLYATPGYDGGHVLRIRELVSDRHLNDLLTKDFPEWLKAHPDSKLTGKTLVNTPLSFIPLDRDETQHLDAKRGIHTYATPLVGALSFVSASALLATDIGHYRRQKPYRVPAVKAAISSVSSGFFLSASALLTWLGWSAARAPSVAELMRSLEPQLNQNPETLPPPQNGFIQQGMNAMFNNPWGVSTLVNAGGVIIRAVGHSIPETIISRNPITLKDKKRYGVNRLELLAIGTSLTSLGFIGSARPDTPSGVLGIASYERARQESDPLAWRYRNFSPFDPANDQGASGHLNMKMAGFLGMVSNIGFGAKGLLDVVAGYRANDEYAKHARKSWPLLLLVPFNVAADYLTTLAKPRQSYAIDEMASEAAAYIAKKLDTKTASPETVTRQTYVLSELLARHPRVTQTGHQLREAIGARLQFDHGYKMPTRGEGLEEYEHLMRISPFAEQEVAKEPKAAGAVAAQAITQIKKPGFVERLQPEGAVLASAPAR